MSRSVQSSVTRLEEIVGGLYAVTDPAQLSARAVCGVRPSVIVRPADAAQIAEILSLAAAEKLAVIPSASGTKLGIGSPPARYDIALDLSRMNRVLAYDPQDLTLGVEPGVRIDDLLGTLAEKKQFLPLAVPFSERATIGGIVATNSSSPLFPKLWNITWKPAPFAPSSPYISPFRICRLTFFTAVNALNTLTRSVAPTAICPRRLV